MSPRRFRVELMLGRTLTRVIETADEDTAAAVAEYLYKEFGDRHFEDSGESIIDSRVATLPEVV